MKVPDASENLRRDEQAAWAALLYETQCCPGLNLWNFNDLMTIHSLCEQLLRFNHLAETCDDQRHKISQ